MVKEESSEEGGMKVKSEEGGIEVAPNTVDEEQFHQEFMAAMKAKKEKEEAEAKAASEETKVAALRLQNASYDSKEDNLGRIYDQDDDILDTFKSGTKKSALEMLQEKLKKKELKAVDHTRCCWVVRKRSEGGRSIFCNRLFGIFYVCASLCGCPCYGLLNSSLPASCLSSIDYAPFRKKFYIESPEIKNLSKEEVAAQRGRVHWLVCVYVPLFALNFCTVCSYNEDKNSWEEMPSSSGALAPGAA